MSNKLKQGIPIKYNENSLFAKFQMKILKRRAKNISIKTGRQQHIVPSGRNHVMIIDNVWRKNFNKYGKNKLSFIQLMEIAYFSTSKHNRVIT